MGETAALPLLIALVVLLALSAFFSASETAFSSLNRIRMKSMAADGNKKAARTLELAEKYDKLLSTVLIGNNIVNILSSSLATVLFVGWFGNLGVTLATVVMTVLVLVFGEITPKTIAKEQPERFAMAVTPFLRAFMLVLTPLNAFFSWWKRFVLRLFKLGSGGNVTEQELLTYVEEVREDGAISAQEEQMIRSVIEFDDVHVYEIATPRVDVKAVDKDTPAAEIAALFHETGFSRVPIYDGTIDNIVGVVLEKDFHYYVQSLGQPLAEVIRPILYTTKTQKISALLTELRHRKIHMAVIVDEYGGTMGIITIEDILEELVGEIWDEHDNVREEVQQLGPGRYRVFGGTETETLFALMGLRDTSAALTAGGWVLEEMGCIPEEGARFTYQNVDITVEKMNQNRVYAILVEAPQKQED